MRPETGTFLSKCHAQACYTSVSIKFEFRYNFVSVEGLQEAERAFVNVYGNAVTWDAGDRQTVHDPRYIQLDNAIRRAWDQLAAGQRDVQGMLRWMRYTATGIEIGSYMQQFERYEPLVFCPYTNVIVPSILTDDVEHPADMIEFEVEDYIHLEDDNEEFDVIQVEMELDWGKLMIRKLEVVGK